MPLPTTASAGLRLTSANPVSDIGSPGAWDWLNVYGPVWSSGQTELLGTPVRHFPTPGKPAMRDHPTAAAGREGRRSSRRGRRAHLMLLAPTLLQFWLMATNSKICTQALQGRPPNHRLCHRRNLQRGRCPVRPPCLPATRGEKARRFLVQRTTPTTLATPDSGWPVDDDSNRRYAYTGGEIPNLGQEAHQGWSVTPGAKVTDFAAAVSARRTSGALGACMGSEFGINEYWSQFYEFIVENASYSIWRYDNGSWTALRDWDPLPIISKPAQTGII